ncbi:MAG: NusG domain II-containing protein [Treponema sp.]|nr:NusG domain II-containing protein [Treponema sp.]
MKKRIKILDIIIIFIAASLILSSAYAAYVMPENTVRVLIRGQDKEWTFPIETIETVTVGGPLGNTVVKINEGRAWIESSPCDNQTCVGMGHVWRQGQWALCLPNKVMLFIEGTDDEYVDSISW